MKPHFTQREIEANIVRWARENERKFILALSYLGEEFVNRARTINTYVDQTGNLRSSIGYVIAKNGNVLKRNYRQIGDANKGVTKGLNLADAALSENPNGIVLIVTAGMNYGLYVETMGYDVLTGSIPSRGQVLNSFYKMIK